MKKIWKQIFHWGFKMKIKSHKGIRHIFKLLHESKMQLFDCVDVPEINYVENPYPYDIFLLAFQETAEYYFKIYEEKQPLDKSIKECIL